MTSWYYLDITLWRDQGVIAWRSIIKSQSYTVTRLRPAVTEFHRDMKSWRGKVTSRHHIMTSHHDVTKLHHDWTSQHDKVMPWYRIMMSHNMTWERYTVTSNIDIKLMASWRHKVTWNHNVTWRHDKQMNIEHCIKLGLQLTTALGILIPWSK